MSDNLELVALARSFERARAELDSYFPGGLFGDPGWSLLLDLYIAHHEGRAVNTSGVCSGANVPQTTGLRWLDRLEGAGLIQRHRHPQDTRFVMVELSPMGLRRMTAFLEDTRDRIGRAQANPMAAGAKRSETV
jgi:hypothetical protein